MPSKCRENKNLVSFICFSFLVISFSKQLIPICLKKTAQEIAVTKRDLPLAVRNKKFFTFLTKDHSP